MDEQYQKILETYKLAVNARNFHYQEFNKWMTFFYVAIGAIFVSFYTLYSKDSPVTPETSLLKELVTFVGFVISVLGYLSSKGYYYWMLNWQNQVTRIEKIISEDFLKGEDTHKVYSVFSEDVYKNKNNIIDFRKSANISTSKITILFYLFMNFVWGGLFFYQFFGLHFLTVCLTVISMFLCYILGAAILPSMGDINKTRTHNLTKP